MRAAYRSESACAPSVRSEGTTHVRALVLRDERIDVGLRHGVNNRHEVVDTVRVDRHAEPELGLDLVAFGNGDIAHVVAESDESHVVRGLPSDGGPGPVGDAGDGVRCPTNDRRPSCVAASPRLDEPELAIAVRRLIWVHEVHVDLSPRRASLICVWKCSMGLRSASRPPIHAFAGEKVCIHEISPTIAVRCRVATGCRIDSALVSTGFPTMGIGMRPARPDQPRLLRVRGDLHQRLLAESSWLPVRNHSSPCCVRISDPLGGSMRALTYRLEPPSPTERPADAPPAGVGLRSAAPPGRSRVGRE